VLKDDYVQVNGVQLHYVSSGEGPLILFLHGFPEFWYAWRNQLAEFGQDHCAVALDMRGFNLSDKPGDVGQYRLNILVEDIRAFADHLSTGKKFVLVGHDWGGVVAWLFAIAHPDALAKLVIYQRAAPGCFRAPSNFRSCSTAGQRLHGNLSRPSSRTDIVRQQF
jgi:epoxide hydrolase 4